MSKVRRDNYLTYVKSKTNELYDMCLTQFGLDPLYLASFQTLLY